MRLSRVGWSIPFKGLALLLMGLCSSSLFAQQPSCHVNPKILVLSNYGSDIVAADFAAHMPGLTFGYFSDAAATPTIDYLNQFDAVLVFEDGNFSNAPNIGNLLYQYYSQSNKGIALGVFYWQDAKDSPIYGPYNYGWGALEAYAPLVNGDGDETRPRTLNAATIVPHVITTGVTSLSVSGYAGGLKASGTALAYWNETNNDGSADPLIAIGENFGSRIAGVSLAPLMPSYGPYSGDFYKLWENTLTWASFASDCGSPTADQYTFTGFMRPMDNLPMLNMVKAGRAVPVKFSLNGDQGLDIFPSQFPASQEIDCASGTATGALEPVSAAGDSALTYDRGDNQYSYIWKTSKKWAGTCRQLDVKLKDGTDHRANFKFVK